MRGIAWLGIRNRYQQKGMRQAHVCVVASAIRKAYTQTAYAMDGRLGVGRCVVVIEKECVGTARCLRPQGQGKRGGR
jgi:hypothetical protein